MKNIHVFTDLLMTTPFINRERNSLCSIDHAITLVNYANYYEQLVPLVIMNNSLRHALYRVGVI